MRSSGKKHGSVIKRRSQWTRDRRGLAKSVDTAQLKEPGKRGFPYRVAASTLAKLKDDGKEIGRGGVRIAQFGPVQTLPGGA